MITGNDPAVTSGTLSGHTFLVIEGAKLDRYQAAVAGPPDLTGMSGALTTTDFI